MGVDGVTASLGRGPNTITYNCMWLIRMIRISVYG